MIDILFVKVGRMSCGMKSGEKLAPECERLAALLGAMFLVTLMAVVTLISLLRMGRIDLIDTIILLLAVIMPQIVFDFCIKPSSQWLSSDRSK